MVQTFLPYEDFETSARCLDTKRLFKQIVEAKQLRLSVFAHDNNCIYYADSAYKDDFDTKIFYKRANIPVLVTSKQEKAIKNKFGKPKKVGWIQHLAAKQWFGYYDALTKYQMVFMKVYFERMWNVSCEPIEIQSNIGTSSQVNLPKWLGEKNYHDSHKRRLYQKDSEYYSEFSMSDDGTGYVWPTNEKEVNLNESSN